MTSLMRNTTPAALLVLASLVAATTADAQVVIFDSNQGGDFYGSEGSELADFQAMVDNPGTTPPILIYNGDNNEGSLLGGRRADRQGDFFFANILFEGTGFGGIDHLGNNDNPVGDATNNAGQITNNNTSNTATFFLNNGNVVGMPDGDSSESDDTLPSGAFPQVFNPGDEITFTADISTNGNGGPTDSTYELSLLFDGGTVPQSIGSGNFPNVGGTTEVTGSFFVTQAASSFNLVSTLTNPGTGDDQIHIDNIVLTLTEDVALVGDVLINGVRDDVLDVNDFNAIRDNFFNTGTSGSLDGEAIGSEDGVVDLDDFIAFRTAFLNSGGTPQQFAAFSAVPEPAAAMTLVCGLVLSGCRRFRRA